MGQKREHNSDPRRLKSVKLLELGCGNRSFGSGAMNPGHHETAPHLAIQLFEAGQETAVKLLGTQFGRAMSIARNTGRDCNSKGEGFDAHPLC